MAVASSACATVERMSRDAADIRSALSLCPRESSYEAVALSRSSLSKKQQRNVAALMQFVSCSERDAIALLRECNWGVHEAAERFFAQQAANAVDTEAVDAWFGKYVEGGSGADYFEEEGVQQFCQDIGVDAETDTIVLAIAWKMDAEEMGTFTRKEFQKGMAALGAETAEALREKLPKLRAEVVHRNQQDRAMRLGRRPVERQHRRGQHHRQAGRRGRQRILLIPF